MTVTGAGANMHSVDSGSCLVNALYYNGKEWLSLSQTPINLTMAYDGSIRLASSCNTINVPMGSNIQFRAATDLFHQLTDGRVVYGFQYKTRNEAAMMAELIKKGIVEAIEMQKAEAEKLMELQRQKELEKENLQREMERRELERQAELEKQKQIEQQKEASLKAQASKPSGPPISGGPPISSGPPISGGPPISSGPPIQNMKDIPKMSAEMECLKEQILKQISKDLASMKQEILQAILNKQ